FQDAHIDRKPSVAPFVDGTIPTTLDKQLAPEGVHVFSMFTQWVPDDWVNEPHREELDAYANRIFDGYNELAPNFRDSIIDYQVIGPYDMEQELGLIGGNIFHGELSVDQLFHMRPAPGFADFRTPIKGLYHGSCATHGGGGVNGIPGWQAYKAAVKDKALPKR
ncbi:MAG: NAD(P)/FAD-dependent oxidoreductase, partial [Actinomycetota bacterium]